MSREEAIKKLERQVFVGLPELGEAASIALAALREQAEREKGCEYCIGALAPLYQISTNGHPSFALFEPAVCPVCGKRLEVEP